MESNLDGCDVTAEIIVGWSLEAQLEKALSAPFLPDYDQIVEMAKRKVMEEAAE